MGTNSFLHKLEMIFAVSLISIGTAGCAVLLVGAGAAVGAGTVGYVAGELKGAESVSLERAWQASLKAMQQLNFKVTAQEHDKLTGKIVARTSEDKRIKIGLKKQSESVTEFRIRIGTFGDETLSRMIYNQIKKNF